MSNILSMFNTPIEEIKGGYISLGMLGNQCVVFSMLTKRVIKLAPSSMKEMELKSLFGAAWCEHHYTFLNEKREEFIFEYRILASDIIRDCQKQGTYISSYERRAGVWQDSDGDLIINGEQLWKPNGEVLEHGLREKRIYSASGTVGFDMETEEANDKEVNDVLSAFNSINWRHALGGELLLGWLGVAYASVALKRRPHILLTGGAGIGKSTILEIAKWLLGPLGFPSTGPQTMAAFYQALAGTSRAVILDEFEADPTRRHSQDTLEIARMSYSLQEGDEGIIRGTPGGISKSYQFYSPFLAAGITPGKMQPADLTRWVTLEAVSRKEQTNQLTEIQAREIGPKLAKRFVSRWSNFRMTEVVIRECIVAAGGDGRLADTVGTLLASYWTFVSDRPATPDDAEVLIEMLDIKARIELHAETDEKRCLDALLSKVMPFKVIDGQYQVTRPLSISQAIALVCDNPTGHPEITNRFSQLGLRVVMQNGVWKMFVVNSVEHQELKKLFSSTKWATGGWSLVLRRLKGGEESTQRIGAGFPPAKVTAFDIPCELLSERNELPLAA